MSGIRIAEIRKAAPAAESPGMLDFLNKDIRLPGSGFNDKKKERFYSELSVLLDAGVDIRSALELIEEEQVKEKDSMIFRSLKDAIVSGVSLSAAAERSGHFTAYEYSSLRLGEESGRLSEVLSELTLFYERKIRQRRQVTSAMSYPVIVFFASFGAVFFMMKFVVPMFADVFKRFKGELPYFTRVIIHLSNWFSNYWLLLIVSMTAVIIFFYRSRKKTWFRKYGAAIVLKTPVFGELVSRIYLARFCQSMNLLISARTPLVTALELMKSMAGFYPIEAAIDPVREDVMRGVPLHLSLAKYPIFNKRMVALIKVAEEVNQMDTMFGRLAAQYSDEVEHQTGILGSLIEPAMIIFLGALVAMILLAMYLPLFQMSSTVG